MGGIGDKKIIFITSPGGNDRMRRLLLLMEHQGLDFSPLVTHTVRLENEEIKRGYDIFGEMKDNAIKVAIKP